MAEINRLSASFDEGHLSIDGHARERLRLSARPGDRDRLRSVIDNHVHARFGQQFNTFFSAGTDTVATFTAVLELDNVPP